MNPLSLREAARLIAGAQILGEPDAYFERVCTDSRSAGPGDLFVALKGERFDGHDFLAEVAARGVAALLVSRPTGQISLPTLQVPDTHGALGALAHGWRRKFELPLVAVTGSNGKTTVKEMIASIFAEAVGEEGRLATRGNFNNDIGLPLTLLRLNAAHQLAVVELGVNHPGETAHLAALTEPTIALINNAQREHQEFMVSVEAVAREHMSVLQALPAHGAAVFPADDVYAPLWRAAAQGRQIIDFALTSEAAVSGVLRAESPLQVRTSQGQFELTLPVLGVHNARNALAATAAALAAGVGLEVIRCGLEKFRPVSGRLVAKVARVAPLAGAIIIDDSYNANPDSMRAAIDVLATRAAPRILVMGAMGEVGQHSVVFHHEVGIYARECGIDVLYALGDATRPACHAFGAQAKHFSSAEELIEHLLSAGFGAHATVLVKGSRFMKMERIVAALSAESTEGQTPVLH
ncbi:UDP-N-acetylmuramoyl-tripeptide--D-alanyl-D-alanine ligase [Mycoavidus sp. B2-EB]|uniref:UDP-N-acetylmuramoyl-tripeptide--D-alanyl-D- alanine ligase n=1 Tax=Mycoavidus sp. B2-EB TaxID=2651972 RepID=UPI001627BFDD|nr:UDP-N-acetylmuramoyl-tripeptide--D-alanyl-D-alanine ligase [Mycoavidus sp. B2-EB]BBO60287.1 UDP-N-acetylmuramoyl-tripeptide--D-alanyl-D-alanine ligase [Mycoavidus sp. B2-EB]